MNKTNATAHYFKCLLLTTLFLLGSCGYVSDKPPANLDVYKVDQLQACKIDIDKLAEIFKNNQEDQIKCLKENFIQYTKYVKNTNSDSVNQSELGDFVKKVFQGQSDSVVKGLSIIFQLNMILLKDEAQKISKGNITPLFELLVTANREAIIITQSIQDMGRTENQGKFFEIREVFKSSVERFSAATLKIMSSKTGNNQSLNIKDFVIDASKKLGNKEIDQDTIDSLIFLKQILVSGQREVITTSELQDLIQKVPQLLTLTFDIYYSTNENFKTDAEQAKFYLDGIKGLYSLIQFNQTDFELVKIDQILKLVKTLYKESTTDFTKFKPSIVVLKTKLLGGNPESIGLVDLRKFLDLVVDVNERIYFDNVTYNIRRELLLGKSKITYQDLSPINLSEYSIFSARRVQELTQNFNQLAVEFKYFRENADSIPFYGVTYKRTHYGFIEASVIRWGAQKIVNSYGHNENGKILVSIKEFETFLNDMKPLLEEFKLWSPNPETFAQNAVLLADLFQGQSTGDLLVNEREATEYITMILSASNLSDNYRKGLTQYCDTGINKDDPLYEVKCFNDHFYELFLNQLNYKKFFPRLNEYVNSSTPEEVQGYLKGIEGFARDINDPKIPMNKRDTILTLGAMVNVETTFIRFDTNFDNVLDYNELMIAFNTVYKDAIIKLAKLKPEQASFAPSIFLYMVAKMEVPPNNDWLDNVKFYSFHKCVQYEICRNKVLDPIIAKRLNIGSLLYYLVNQGQPTANTTNKKVKTQ